MGRVAKFCQTKIGHELYRVMVNSVIGEHVDDMAACLCVFRHPHLLLIPG